MSGTDLRVIPILHPAAILRGRWDMKPVQVEFIKRAAGLAAGTWAPASLELNNPQLTPTPVDCKTWERELFSLTDPTITVDIECAGPYLVCIGMCMVETEIPICVRFRSCGGDPWPHPTGHLESLVRWSYQLLANPAIPKWFQNGQAFDIPYLHRVGFKVNGYAGDTMLLQRYMYPGMPANLEFLASFYAEMPGWKWMVKGSKEEDGEGK